MKTTPKNINKPKKEDILRYEDNTKKLRPLKKIKQLRKKRRPQHENMDTSLEVKTHINIFQLIP